MNRKKQHLQPIQPDRTQHIQELVDQTHTDATHYNRVATDPDWHQIAQTIPNAETWTKLTTKYGRETVAKAHKFWTQNGRPKPQ